MKKILFSILITVISIFPFKVMAEGYISAAPKSLTIEQGSSKAFTITAYNAIGDVYISSSNSGVASVSTEEWGTGMVEEKNTKTGTIIVTGKSLGSTTINLTIDGATFDSEDLSDQTIIINVTVVEKPTPPPAPPAQPSQPSTNNNTNNTNKKEETKKNNDATLKLLSITEGKINFDKNKTEYNVEVEYNIEKITLKAEANNSKSKVTLPKDLNLKVGKNTFEIKVEAEDKTTKIYKLNVTRLERKLSTNSRLKSIEIKGSSLTLEDNKYVYDIKDIKTNSIEINAVTEDENATVKVYGEKSIGKQDVIVIEVTAEDGTTSNYILHVNNIEDEKQNNKYNIILYVIIIVLALLSVGISTGVIIKLNKKRNNI